MSKKRFLFVSLATLAMILISFSTGFYVQDATQENRSQFPILDQAYQIMNNHFHQALPEPPALEYGMIRGMLQASGDPYALFLEPTSHELETDTLEGKFGGIGAELVRSENGEVTLFPFPDSPAALAGIQSGDLLLAVDDLVITPGIALETIQAAIRGSVDESVRLTISREIGSAPLEFVVTRKEVPLPSVTWRLHPDSPSIGIIDLNIIASSTPNEIVRAVDEMDDQGATSYILDLRDNGGGLLVESIQVARLFLESGEILEQQYRGQSVESFSVEKPGKLSKVNLALLVNNNTASAAEVIAGAIKANSRAPVIGTPTFGKDSIQLVFDLDDGSSMHITAAHWWIPGLQPPIGEAGVQPDVIISTENTVGDPIMDAAVELLSRGS